MSESKKPNIAIRFLKFLFPWKGDRAGEVVRKLVFLISIIALIVCGIYFAQRFSQRKQYSQAKELSGLVSDSDETNDAGEMEKYKDLQSINSDFIGWLRIRDTGVDVPVVQTGDNDTYLRKDFYGNYSVYGNPFLDFRNKPKNLFAQNGGKLTAVDAGHEFPIIKQPDGHFEIMQDPHGFVLGGLAGMSYDNYELQLEPGSTLFLYTDGVPEATDPQHQLFGMRRLVEALNKEPQAGPEQLMKNVRQDVDVFVKNAEQFDDLTMLCLKYLGPHQEEQQ